MVCLNGLLCSFWWFWWSWWWFWWSWRWFLHSSLSNGFAITFTTVTKPPPGPPEPSPGPPKPLPEPTRGLPTRGLVPTKFYPCLLSGKLFLKCLVHLLLGQSSANLTHNCLDRFSNGCSTRFLARVLVWGGGNVYIQYSAQS